MKKSCLKRNKALKRIPKPRTYKTAKKQAWDSFSRYIRLRDCLHTTQTAQKGACFTCGRVHPYKELQSGHFVAGRGNSVLFDELGVRAQCRRCNIFKNGEPLIYRRKLVDLYGEEIVRAMEDKRWRPKQYKVFELDTLNLYYRNKYEELLLGTQTHKLEQVGRNETK